MRPDGGVRDVRMRAYAVRGKGMVGPRLVGTSQDVTAEHEARDLLAASEARYRDLALHDSLTGLAKRELFNDRLEHLLRRRGPVEPTAVIMIDLDDFKSINDTLGHAAGDELLAEVASRLMRCTRPEDTVARLGGDEFSVLMKTDDPEIATELGRRIAERSAPWRFAGRTRHQDGESSPPRRATVSSARVHRISRRATSVSSSSPAACPSVSLMLLKSSRSIMIQPPARPARDGGAVARGDH